VNALTAFYAQLDKKFLAKAAAGALAFIAFELLLILWVDKPLAEAMSEWRASTPAVYSFFLAITDIGKAKWFLFPTGLIAIFCAFAMRGKGIKDASKRISAAIGAKSLFIFGTVAFSGILTNIIKLSLGRARPGLWLTQGIFGFDPLTISGYMWRSMPSGHTTTVFTLAFALTVLYPRLRALWFLAAAFLAASRIVIDMHYLSDVFAGVAVAWISVRFFVNYGMHLIDEIIFPIDKSTAIK